MNNTAKQMDEYLDYLWFIYSKLWCVKGITIKECAETNVDYMKAVRQQENFIPFLKKVIKEFAADKSLVPALKARRDKMARLGCFHQTTGCGADYWEQWNMLNDAIENC